MTIRGSCLCGGVRFELAGALVPFEQCHCSRCRKSSGSAFMPEFMVRSADVRWLSGRELVRRFELPIAKEPPAYARIFCSVCGCHVPEPDPKGKYMGIPAGILDDDPGVRPERHIFVEKKAAWHAITDGLPQLDEPGIRRFRAEARDRAKANPR